MLIDLLTDELNLSLDAARVVEKALLFAAILVAVWLARRIIDYMLPRLLQPFAERTETRVDDRLETALVPPLRFLITVGGLALAVLTLQLPALVNAPVKSLVNSLVAFAIFWAMFRLVDPIGDLLAWLYRRTAKAVDIPRLLLNKMTQAGKQLTRGIIVVLGFVAILEAWSLDVNGLIAGFGIAGAAVALATKDTLANLLGYFVILADEPFNETEYVVIGDVSGTVEHVGFRSTRVRALDQSLVTVPNNTIMNANVTNWSRLTKRRLNMTLSLDVGSSADQVLSVVQAIRAMLRAHPAVEPDSVTVQFTDLSAKTLDIMIICFMKIPGWGDFQAARQDINLRIMRLLTQRGVELALPRTVMMEATPPSELERPDVLPGLPPLKPEPTRATATVSPVPDDADNDAADRP